MFLFFCVVSCFLARGGWLLASTYPQPGVDPLVFALGIYAVFFTASTAFINIMKNGDIKRLQEEVKSQKKK